MKLYTIQNRWDDNGISPSPASLSHTNPIHFTNRNDVCELSEQSDKVSREARVFVQQCGSSQAGVRTFFRVEKKAVKRKLDPPSVTIWGVERVPLTRVSSFLSPCHDYNFLFDGVVLWFISP